MRHKTHNCGGTLLKETHVGHRYVYCDRCGAFAFGHDEDDGDTFPTGTDREANRDAWDDARERSPDAPAISTP